MATPQTASSQRLVLHPTRMSQAFLLVPEDHVTSPRVFLTKLCETKPEVANSLTFGKLLGILRDALRGAEIPSKLRL